MRLTRLIVPLATIAAFSAPTIAQQGSQQGPIPNPYLDTTKDVNNILNQSLSGIGKREIEITIQSPGEVPRTYYTPYAPPNPKDVNLAPYRDTYPAALLDLNKTLYDCVRKIQKNQSTNATITIRIIGKGL